MSSATTLHPENLSAEGKVFVSLKRLGEEVANHSVGRFVLEGDLFALDHVGNKVVFDIDMSCSLARPLVASIIALLMKNGPIYFETL